MRLIRIEKRTDTLEGGMQLTRLVVDFITEGVPARLALDLPVGWDSWTRPQRVTWARQQVAGHLLGNRYVSGGEVIFPDMIAPEAAKGDFENLPGWATFTAAEAEAWIETNVTSLATAKTALKAMSKAIVYLRDVVIER
jgi:hypothetical protein